MNLKLFFILFLIVLATIFIVQNSDVVELRFLFWKVAMSRALMFISFALIGVAVGWVLHGRLLQKTPEKETKES